MPELPSEPRLTADSAGLWLRGVTWQPPGKSDQVLAPASAVDILLADGLIARIEPPELSASGLAVSERKLGGWMLLPAPAEAHAHWDKAYTIERIPNPSGTLYGAEAGWRTYTDTATHKDFLDRATHAAASSLAAGVTLARSHVDLGASDPLLALYALLQIREEVAGRMQVQLVAMPRSPLTGPAGTSNRAILREALASGADLVGGCPWMDEDPAGCLEILLNIAGEFGVGVDLHTDETTDPATLTLLEFARKVVATGFPHPATASHCVSLAGQHTQYVHHLAEQVAMAGIAVVCCPASNLYLQGRPAHGDDPADALPDGARRSRSAVQEYPVPRGITAVQALRAAGVLVAAGGDNVENPFNPVGCVDPLDTARLMVLAAHDDAHTAYASVSHFARQVLSRDRRPLTWQAGTPAELLAVPAGSLHTALACRPTRRVVIHHGRIVAEGDPPVAESAG